MMPTFVSGIAPGYAGTAVYRTHSVPGPCGVVFERDLDLSPFNDDEIMIATVRVRTVFRRLSVEEGASLPERPTKKKSYLSRLSTRLTSPSLHQAASGSGYKYTAIKLPRRDYKRYFARDREGNYVGTEPEREWDSEDLEREFGRYQELALRSVADAEGEGEGGRGRLGSVQGDEGANAKDVERKEDGDERRRKSEEEWWL